MTVIKICGILMISLCSVIILKHMKSEQAYLPAIAGAAVSVVILVSGSVSEAVTTIKDVSEQTEYGQYITVLLKALGISYLTVMTADICRNAGEEMLAGAAQTAGKFEILALCLPLAVQLIDTAKELL